MRCRTCNYPLWNLRERICPECGAGFRPSEFDLVPSAVQFCCKGCMQPYYGMTWRGHLDPAEFDCVRCGARVLMDECVLLPTEGVDEDRTQQGYNAWLDRRRNVVSRFFGAVGQAMGSPTAMARGTPMDTAASRAFVFSLLANTAIYAVCWGPMFMISAFAGWRAVGQGAVMTGFFVGAAVIGAGVWTLLAHAILRLTGPVAGTLRHTALAIHFAAGANVLSALFCFGWMFGWIWWAISASLMLARLQRVSAVRAAAAGVLTPVACAVLVFFGYVALMSWTATTFRTTAIGGVGGGPPPPPAPFASSATAAAESVRGGVVSLAESAGAFASHPAELIAYRQVPVSLLTMQGSATTDETALVGGEALRGLDLMQPGQRLQAFQAAMAREAGDPSPWRRLGDVLMPSLGGVSVAGAREAGLWVVVLGEDPDANPGSAGAGQRVIVVGVDGPARELLDAEVDAALAEQNRARGAAGLPALDDPRAARHWRPSSP